MSEETLNERVITVFNNWFLSQHGLLPQQAIDRIAELEAQKNPPHILTLMQQVDELEAKHTALEDAIEVLADQMENEGPTNRTWYIELRSLLGKEKDDE